MSCYFDENGKRKLKKCFVNVNGAKKKVVRILGNRNGSKVVLWNSEGESILVGYYVGTGGYSKLRYSTNDGLKWKDCNCDIPIRNVYSAYGIKRGNGKIVIACYFYDYKILRHKLISLVSEDGKNFTSTTIAILDGSSYESADVNHFIFSNVFSKFLLLKNENTLIHSDDGVNWNSVTIPAVTENACLTDYKNMLFIYPNIRTTDLINFVEDTDKLDTRKCGYARGYENFMIATINTKMNYTTSNIPLKENFSLTKRGDSTTDIYFTASYRLTDLNEAVWSDREVEYIRNNGDLFLFRFVIYTGMYIGKKSDNGSKMYYASSEPEQNEHVFIHKGRLYKMSNKNKLQVASSIEVKDNGTCTIGWSAVVDIEGGDFVTYNRMSVDILSVVYEGGES